MLNLESIEFKNTQNVWKDCLEVCRVSSKSPSRVRKKKVEESTFLSSMIVPKQIVDEYIFQKEKKKIELVIIPGLKVERQGANRG